MKNRKELVENLSRLVNHVANQFCQSVQKQQNVETQCVDRTEWEQTEETNQIMKANRTDGGARPTAEDQNILLMLSGFIRGKDRVKLELTVDRCVQKEK